MSIRRLKDLGTLNAPVLVVGGGPHKEDMLQRQVFSDSSQAWKVFSHLRDAGLRKSDCYFTTLVDRNVPIMEREGFDDAVRYKQYRREEVERGMDCVWDIANRMPNLKAIVALGNYPTRAFIDQGNGMWFNGNEIGKVRGSVYFAALSNNRQIKCHPMLDPHKVKNFQKWERRARLDWKKLVRHMQHPGDLLKPKRYHNVAPTIEDIRSFRQHLTPETILSLDIEIWGGVLKCVGFSTNPYESLVIPTEVAYWKKQAEGKPPGHAVKQWALIWKELRALCASDADKLLQNGLFDAWWLAKFDIPLRGYYWDTLGMHHALYPTDSHSLDYMASIYTDQPYWKDEGKVYWDGSDKQKQAGMENLYSYCGDDVTVTHEIFDTLYCRLADRGKLPFYLKHYADMHPALLRLMLGGVGVDHAQLTAAREKFEQQAIVARDAAIEIAQKPLFTVKTQLEKAIYEQYTNGASNLEELQKSLAFRKDAASIPKKFAEQQSKGISDQRLASVLWDDLGAPTKTVRTTKTGKQKVDSIALRKLKLDVDGRKKFSKDAAAKIVQLVDLTLAHRRAHKLATFVNPVLVDDDQRLRCTYKFTTKTGRLASASNPGGTGLNLQNIDRKLRYLFIPTWGHVLLEVDLSQAESRVVGVLTGHPEMIEQARVRPDAFDVHKANAVLIYSALWGREVSLDEVTYEMRYLGKRAVHAASYGMRGLRLSEILLKEGEVYTPAECQKLIDAYMEMRPAIRDWQAQTREVMGMRRRLYTSWEREVDFEHIRFDDEVYRFGYSYIPQSEVGDLLNQQGLRPLDALLALSDPPMRSRLVLQCHDSVVVDAHPEEVYDIMVFLKKHLERPRTYGACLGRSVELSIPAEFAIGAAWQQGKDWKALPSREEVEAYVEELLCVT